MERQISVIIPTLNEEQNLRDLLPRMKGAELIVVDGHSTDRTKDVAEGLGARVLLCDRGRAKQCNMGAACANGDILYFLHADGRPPVDWKELILKKIGSGADAGCFRMKWDDDHLVLNFFSWWTRYFKSKFRGGDQSLFVSKAFFEQIGAYTEMPLFEDVEIIERIAKHGQFELIDTPLITSSRRYREVGVCRLQWYYGILHAMYRSGSGIDKLKKQYDRTVGAY